MHAAALVFRLIDNIRGQNRVVVDRVGVGHAADAGEAALRRRLRAADDIFFIFITGITQVAV